MVIKNEQTNQEKTIGKLKRQLGEEETAYILGYSRKTLQAWRAQGRGPRYTKYGRSIRYPEDALIEFQKSLQECRSTSEYAIATK